MRKTKRVMAVVLAATMVLGSSLTAFADEPVTSGGTNGAGTSEGHVNKHVISVTLPVIPDGSTPFAYTMDPERLVNETNAAKYAEGSTFTDSAKTNGVYFQTGEKAYDDKSTVLKVKSESSADVKLTVDVEVESAATDIELVDAAPALTGEDAVTDPQLYLALKVDDTTKAVKSSEKVSIETTIEGKDDNFETKYESGAYVYKAKTGDSITWNEAAIQMSGVASKASAEGLTAPTLKVTWKYEDPAANNGPSVSGSSFVMTAGEDVNIPVNLGVGELAATGITSAIWNNTDLYGSTVTYSNGVVTLASGSVDYLLGDETQPRTLTITFNDEAATEVTVTLTAE
ncbi:MAG: hypothetical protein J6I76_14315 [Oribacterium sp.]|nr:hypothetical protein [Oribacterium sp.]